MCECYTTQPLAVAWTDAMRVRASQSGGPRQGRPRIGPTATRAGRTRRRERRGQRRGKLMRKGRCRKGLILVHISLYVLNLCTFLNVFVCFVKRKTTFQNRFLLKENIYIYSFHTDFFFMTKRRLFCVYFLIEDLKDIIGVITI